MTRRCFFSVVLFAGVAPALLAHAVGLGAAGRNVRSDVQITVRDGYRYIRSNGLPDHRTGQFPNRGNPNSIREQNYSYRVPLNPDPAKKISELHHMPFGVALNGVPFDPGTAEYWRNDRRSGWRYEALSGKINLGLDDSNAHVQPTGAYHYHGMPKGLMDQLSGLQEKMLLLGYAADGFPIYGPLCYADSDDPNSKLRRLRSSYRLKKGRRPGGPSGRYDGTFVQDYEYAKGAGDLDECNGHFGVTPDYAEGTYYYVLTDDFPFIPRYLRGTPDESFARRGPGGGPPGPRGPGGRPGFGPPGSRPGPPGRKPPGPPPPG